MPALRLIRLPLLLAALAAAAPAPAAAAVPALRTVTTVTASADPVGEGQAVVLTATVDGPGWPSGTVVFSDYELGQLQSVPVSQGQAVATIPSLPAGLHQISAAFQGDGTFAPSDGSLTLLVGARVAPTLTLSADRNPGRPGQRLTLAAVLQTAQGYGTASGTLSVSEDGVQLAQVPLSLAVAPAGHGEQSNQVSFPVQLSPGIHTLQASYGGDAHLAPATSGPWTEVVGEKVATSTTLISAANPSLGGQPAMLTATVAPSTPSSRQPSGTITFRDGTTVLGHASLAAGSASLGVSLAQPGDHALTVAYSGDGDFQASTSDPLGLQVLGLVGGPTSTATALAAGPNPAAFGQLVTFKASVAAISGPATPAGSVYFADEGGAVLGSADLDSGGEAELTISGLPPGPHRVRAVYSGGARFAHSSSDALDLNVERAQPVVAPLPSTVQNGSVTMGVGVAGVAGTAPAGSVTFVEEGAVVGTAPVQDQGRALLSAAGLAPGLHRLVAVYNGDGNYASASSSLSVLVPGIVATSTAVQADAQGPLPSQRLRLQVTVTPAGPAADAPSGSVVVEEGDAVLGEAQLDGQGRAELEVSGLPPGSHTLTASFPGSGSLGASTGTATVQVSDDDPDHAP